MVGIMPEPIETKYTGQEYLELFDSLSGAVLTLEQSVDDYIHVLGEYVSDGEVDDSDLDYVIENTVDSLEMVYDSLEKLDEMLEDENLVARVQKENEKGFTDLEDDLKQESGGLYDKISCLDDLLTFFGYVEYDDFEAEEGHLRYPDNEVEAPTKIIENREKLLQLNEDLEQQYNRIVHSEVFARENTGNALTFDPEPPIFRILGHKEYLDRINNLNNKFTKLKKRP